MPDKKINIDTITGQIISEAIKLIKNQPDGVSWTELKQQLEKAFPDFHPKTINGCVWKLVENFPDSIYKPKKGLFMHKANKK